MRGPEEINPGDDLLSQAVAHQVPSALQGLTSLFGMGRGMTLALLSPETLRERGAERSAGHKVHVCLLAVVNPEPPEGGPGRTLKPA